MLFCAFEVVHYDDISLAKDNKYQIVTIRPCFFN